MDDELKSLVKQELLQAIAYFIERQQLVAQAMVEMGLDLDEVGRYKAVAWVSYENADTFRLDQLREEATDEQTLELIEVAKRAQARGVPQKGTWQDKHSNEWEYYLHGGGCSLLNRRTKETIDWDCPNPLAFDPFFFYRHLEWQLSSPERRDGLLNTQQWVRQAQQLSIDAAVDPLVREMRNEGLIDADWMLSRDGKLKLGRQ
jgi:hypothetical protein